jgi:hypothetical protein
MFDDAEFNHVNEGRDTHKKSPAFQEGLSVMLIFRCFRWLVLSLRICFGEDVTPASENR